MERFPVRYFMDIPPVGQKENFFLPVWRELLKIIPAPARILDVGCGTGTFGLDAKQLTGAFLSGIDGSEFALSQANAGGYDETVKVANLDCDTLPYSKDSFDFCLCKDVLEHLLDPEHVVQEIARVVRPAGYLLVHVPNHFTLLGRLRMLWNNNIDTYNYFPTAKRWDFPHVRFFDYQSVIALLTLAGFEYCANFCSQFPSVPGGRFIVPSMRIRKAMATRWPNAFAEGLTILAKKSAGPEILP